MFEHPIIMSKTSARAKMPKARAISSDGILNHEDEFGLQAHNDMVMEEMRLRRQRTIPKGVSEAGLSRAIQNRTGDQINYHIFWPTFLITLLHPPFTRTLTLYIRHASPPSNYIPRSSLPVCARSYLGRRIQAIQELNYY